MKIFNRPSQWGRLYVKKPTPLFTEPAWSYWAMAGFFAWLFGCTGMALAIAVIVIMLLHSRAES